VCSPSLFDNDNAVTNCYYVDHEYTAMTDLAGVFAGYYPFCHAAILL